MQSIEFHRDYCSKILNKKVKAVKHLPVFLIYFWYRLHIHDSISTVLDWRSYYSNLVSDFFSSSKLKGEKFTENEPFLFQISFPVIIVGIELDF